MIKEDTSIISARQTLIACAAFVALIASIDAVTANINLSILYALPVLLISQAREQMASQIFVLATVVLTFLGYFLGPRPHGSDGLALTFIQMLSDWRMFNRTLSAVALCGISGISSLQIRFHMALERRRSELEASDADARIYEEILHSFKQLVAVIASIVIIAVVAIADFVTPPQYNLPILYGLPLAIAATTQRRAMIWSILPVLLTFTWAGYVIGPASSDIAGHIGMQAGISEPSVVLGKSILINAPSLLTNRTLAACAMVVSTLLLHVWMRPSHPKPLPLRSVAISA